MLMRMPKVRLFRARQRVLKAFGAKENSEAVSKAGFGSADDSSESGIGVGWRYRMDRMTPR